MARLVPLTTTVDLSARRGAIRLRSILRGAEPNGLCRNELRDRMLTRMPDPILRFVGHQRPS